MLDNIIQLKTLDLFVLVTIPKRFPQERQQRQIHIPNANVKRQCAVILTSSNQK